MIRRSAVAIAMVAVIVLVVLAGFYHLHIHRLKLEIKRRNEVVLTPANPSTADTNPMGATLTGKPAPAFTLIDLNGKKVSLADFKGHPVVLNFWATWCGPCKLEMPWFEQMYGKYSPQGLVILGISQDDGMDTADIAKAVKKIGVTYPILQPDEKVSKAYQLSDYLPETMYLDKNGIVVDQTIGAHSKDELEADIQKSIAAGAK